jgi:hypothetical protein
VNRATPVTDVYLESWPRSTVSSSATSSNIPKIVCRERERERIMETVRRGVKGRGDGEQGHDGESELTPCLAAAS